MSQDQKLQQRWQFRRGDNDLDSSSNDTKSSSRGEPVLKKHKLVSNLILPENDETSNTPLSQPENQLGPYMDIPFECGKADKMHTGLNSEKRVVKKKIKRGSMKRSNRKTDKRSVHEPFSLDDFKVFMKSMIEELKVARENMFTRMREEMKKLVTVELGSRTRRKEEKKIGRAKYQNNDESGVKTKNCNGGSLEKSAKSDRTTDSNNCYEVLGKQVNRDQTVGPITSKEKEKVEKLSSSVKKPIYASNLSEQIVSSPYSTLPTVLSRPQAENHRLDASCNYIQPGETENKTGLTLERAKLLIESSNRRGYFSGIQKTEQFGSFSQMGSQNLSYFAHRNTQTSTVGSGFPVPLHHGLGNGFNIPSQTLDSSSRENNILGLRMNGGAIRLSGGSHALSEHFVSSNLRSQMNYKTDGGPLGFGNQDLKDGSHLYRN
ncbi:Proton pump-interactor like [Actinidia chinensis var. chinensis]|uniref:Proton pump-interactor like n=1 Tax=Actinidia chinensis var. chinensis TaxID=1590841 RepID=A0A2R6QN94_ACTCC|nr:Proton pump-interactor like [Actinidia chinensis var. chinensis]